MPNYQRLNHTHRYMIYRSLKKDKKQREIAEILGVSESTISREISRNSTAKGYCWDRAQRLAEKRKLRQRRSKIIVGQLADEIEERLIRHHSPDQISCALRKEGRAGASHQTIYEYVQRDKKAGGNLFRCLRINGVRRYRVRSRAGRSKILNRTGIEDRPESVAKRLFYGDWEADLVKGSYGKECILTLVDRKSRYTIFRKLENKTKEAVATMIISGLKQMKVRTITYDNGLEFSDHLKISKALGAKGYFCNPYKSWEKGLVENHNGLLRQYFERGSSFAGLEPELLQEVETEINERPRKTLEYNCPINYLSKLKR